jgi:hypothetical protein
LYFIWIVAPAVPTVRVIRRIRLTEYVVPERRLSVSVAATPPIDAPIRIGVLLTDALFYSPNSIT